MMRDIKRNSEKDKHFDLPPLDMGEVEEIELFEASQASKEKARQEKHQTPTKRESKQGMDLSGKTVEVAKVKTEKNDIENGSEPDSSKQESRPLFAAASLTKKRRGVWMGKSERKIMLGLIGLGGLAALVSGIIFIPTAKISLKLRTAPLLADEEVIIGQGENGVIPGTSFYREVAVSGNWQVANREVIGDKSHGTVEIINNTTEEQKIKDQSRLETKDGVMFYMQKHAIIPPHSRAAVEVVAAEEGEGGNIDAGRLDFVTFDEQSRQVVWAEAGEPFTGGSGETIAVIADSDLTAAKQEASAQARQQASQQIKNELPNGWELLEESWQTEISNFSSTGQEGDKVPMMDYQSQVIVRVMGYEKELFERMMKEYLEKRLDQDYMLFPGPISFSQTVKNLNWEDAQATVAVRVTHSTVPNIAVDTLRQKLAGRSLEEAGEYLEGLPGVRSTDIELWPFWVKSIPRIDRRVTIELESEKKI